MMEKVFITNSKLQNIAFHLDQGQFTKDEVREFIEGRFLKSFNHDELKTMSAVKLVLESIQDEDLQITLIGQVKKNREIKSRENKNNLVYNHESHDAFHKDELCSTLGRDYENYVIPVEIEESRHNDFRKFFMENEVIYKDHSDIFFARAEMQFNVKIHNVQEIHKPNSGSSSLIFTHKMPNEVLAEMDTLASEMDDYKNQSAHIRKVIDNTSMNINKALSNPLYAKDHHILDQWKTYKSDMRNLITEYLYSVFSPERRFSRAFLGKLGFRECGCCFKPGSDSCRQKEHRSAQAVFD